VSAQVWASADLRPARRTNGAMGISFALHALLIAWLVLQPHVMGVPEVLTEVQYYDAMPVAAAPVAIPAPEPMRQVDGTQPDEARFARHRTVAEEEPVPQSDFALDDRIASRLDALREPRRVAPIASATPVPSRLMAAPASTPAPRGEAVALSRGPAEQAPIALQRGAPVARRLDVAVAPTPVPKAEAEAPAGATTATRQLGNASLMGPVADRPIAHHVMPEYPEWAKRDAVEATVTVRFVVRPDGSIKENVFVQKTAGFEDFDFNAVSAIKAWRFAPLAAGRTGEQWGAITFRFRLRDTG